MENVSGIKPVGFRVLVLPREVEEKTESGIVLANLTVEKEYMAQIEATVIEVAPGCWSDAPEGQWCAAGDTVLIGKYAGLVNKGADGKRYRIINDRDIVAVLQ